MDLPIYRNVLRRAGFLEALQLVRNLQDDRVTLPVLHTAHERRDLSLRFVVKVGPLSTIALQAFVLAGGMNRQRTEGHPRNIGLVLARLPF